MLRQLIKLSSLSKTAFESFGLDSIAYIKEVDVNGKVGYGVYAADGTQLSLMDTKEVAQAILIQNDLEPHTLH